MRKVKKIMDIPVQEISFTDGSPVAVEICDIRHTPVHSHRALIEMILCLRGSISIICNQEHLVLKKGELFSVGFDDLHCIYSDEENITVFFYMDMKKMHLPWETLKYTYFACEDISREPYQHESLQRIKSCILAYAYQHVKCGASGIPDCKEMCRSMLEILLRDFDWFNHINLAPNCDNELRR